MKTRRTWFDWLLVAAGLAMPLVAWMRHRALTRAELRGGPTDFLLLEKLFYDLGGATAVAAMFLLAGVCCLVLGLRGRGRWLAEP